MTKKHKKMAKKSQKNGKKYGKKSPKKLKKAVGGAHLQMLPEALQRQDKRSLVGRYNSAYGYVWAPEGGQVLLLS